MSHKKIDRKSLDFTGFSPVKPLSISTPKHDYGIRERIAIITKQTQEWHAKWQLAQKRGASICSSIENLIKNHLASKDNSNLFNPDFAKSCEDLRIITSVFQDLIANLKKACDQLESSLNLPNINGKLIYGKTWSLENLIDFLKITLQFYRKEYEIKLKVMENIPHSSSTNDLILHRFMWEYPLFANSDLDLKFLILKQEFPYE